MQATAKLALSFSLCASLIGAAGAVHAQGYPAKSVRVMVGLAAGGSVDLVARVVGQKLSESLGQQFIVDNRPGAGGNIAGELVAKAPPDGYTLFVSSSGALGTNLAIYTKMPYDPLKDFTPIALLVYQGNILIVNPTVPARSVKELVALAKSRSAQLTYGSGGNGSSQHMASELFLSMTGAQMVHVPYKGGAPAMADLLGGQIDLMFQTVPEAIPYLKSNRVRALGVTSATRSAVLSEVPTLAEAGIAGYDFDGWMGLVGPAGMNKDLTARLNAETNKALANPEVRHRLQELGLEIAAGSPELLERQMREQSAKMVKLAKTAGIKPVD